MKFYCLVLFLLGFFTTVTLAQDKSPVIFGKITIKDFLLPPSPIIGTGTSAVIIADKGSTVFAGNGKGGLSPIFKRYVRIKIVNKTAFELATVKLSLYHRGEDAEKLTELTAVTYNAENGKVVESRLKKEDIFSTRQNLHNEEKKFTLPAVKEGSIIEYTYSLTSDFIGYLHDWTFQQTRYPCLWSEYEVDLPRLLQYSIISQLFHPFYIDKAGEGFTGYTVRESSAYTTAESDHLSVRINTVKHRWVMKDIPAFNENSYLYTPYNYIDRLSFQLSRIDYGMDAALNGRDPVNISNSWGTITKELLSAASFGAPLNEDNAWMMDVLNQTTSGVANQQEEIWRIYQYVRENFTSTGNNGIYLSAGLRDVFNRKAGTAGELNLLLVAMLVKKGIPASPVLLSTREYGVNTPAYPIMDRLNYVICKAGSGSNEYFLDASDPFLGFAKLPLNCYNGHARIIKDKDSCSIFFLPESIKELKNTTVFIQNDENGETMSGNYQSVPGYHQSYTVRKEVNKAGIESYAGKIQVISGIDCIKENIGIDSLSKLEEPVKIHFDFQFNTSGDHPALLYFNPIIEDLYKVNPFIAEDRQYPVELSQPLDELYVLTMDIPKGFIVEEMPSSVKLAFNENEGFYEYIIQKTDEGIQLRSRIKLNRALYRADEYNALRDFFAFVVKKQAEQIVFKKAK